MFCRSSKASITKLNIPKSQMYFYDISHTFNRLQTLLLNMAQEALYQIRGTFYHSLNHFPGCTAFAVEFEYKPMKIAAS